MDDFFGAGSRQIQDRLDTRRLADRIHERRVSDTISDDDKQFIEARDMLFMASVDEHGNPNCSYKGGDPGFIRVVDERTIAFPSYDGNGMYISMGNVLTSGSTGFLFVDFESQRRMRLNGTASIDWEDPLMSDYPEAQFIVRVSVREVFPNCPRYIHKMQLVERSQFVPRADRETPLPDWKFRSLREYLPERDKKKVDETERSQS